MKKMKSVLVFLVLVASSVLTGCSTDEYDEVFEEKVEYTVAEKAEIRALAKKYKILLDTLADSKGEKLMTISEIESYFNKISSKEKTTFKLQNMGDGVFRPVIFNTHTRSKTLAENGSKSNSLKVSGYDEMGRDYIFTANLTVTWKGNTDHTTGPNSVSVSGASLTIEDENVDCSDTGGIAYTVIAAPEVIDFNFSKVYTSCMLTGFGFISADGTGEIEVMCSLALSIPGMGGS